MSAKTYCNQTARFLAAVTTCMPPIPSEIMQGWIENPKSLRNALAEALCPPEPMGSDIIDFDKTPFIPSCWTILPDSEQLPNRVKGKMKFDLKKVALHLDNDQENGKVIQANDLRKKLEKVPVYGAQLLDFLFENPHLIPQEWKEWKGRAVFFWGTIYRANGRLFVRYLYWSGGRWDWDCRWLGVDWTGYDPAAVLTN
ncbi:hypothetical protein IT397_01765 [Candidatus Nomurabacteria bacterium]|nr:hypothetical protein [Candidatus Nomurabacteria bacterium]